MEPSQTNHGYRVTAAALGINLALGILYSWNVVSQAIPGAWHWTDKEKSWPYSIACLVFALMMVPAGRLQDKLGPRLAASLGGLLVGLGMIVASRSSSPLGYMLGFGLLVGSGLGFGYASTTPTAVKWFPAARTGMVAGIAVSGFGLASVYAAPLTQALINNFGLPAAMMSLGIAFLVVVVGLAQLLIVPPKGYSPGGVVNFASGTTGKQVDFSPIEMLRTHQFYLLWSMYACAAGAGLMVISKLGAIAKEQAGYEKGFVLVAALAVGNGLGRITSGIVSDRIGRRPTLCGCMLFQAVLIGLFLTLVPGTPLASLGGLIAISALIGANYGAMLCLFPSITKDFYGLKNLGVNYGLVYTSWGIGGFTLPLLAGHLHDIYKNYFYSYYLSSSLLILGALLTLAVRTPHSRNLLQESSPPLAMAEADR